MRFRGLAGLEHGAESVEGAGHSLYDPGIRDAVMRASRTWSSKIHRIEEEQTHAARGKRRNAVTSMDIDPSDEPKSTVVRPANIWRARRNPAPQKHRRYVAHEGQPKYLCSIHAKNLQLLDSRPIVPRSNTTRGRRPHGPTSRNMISQRSARITVSRGQRPEDRHGHHQPAVTAPRQE